jgi:uncharacterized membrane protein YbhN (UPF0104 family)
MHPLRIVKIAVSAGILAFLACRVDVGSVLGALGGLRPGLAVAALALYMVGQLISAGKWKLVATALGFRRRYGTYVAFCFIGMFFNLIGPSTVGGDLVRGLALGGKGQRALALNSVVFDRTSGLVVLVGMGLVSLLVFPQYGLPAALVRLTALVVVGLLACWWMLPRLVALLLPAGHRLRQFVEHDLRALWGNQWFLLSVVIVSGCFHLVQVTVQFTLARALGLAVPFSYCLVFHPAVAVLAALPVTVSGLGVREGGYVFFLHRIGVSAADAFGFGLAWFAILVLGALPGGVLLMWRGETAKAVREAGEEGGSRSRPARRP